jgi:regulator of sigma E protease
MGFIENTVAFIFVIGVMVLIHELGHFLAARYFDVKVETFSIGFGPRLFGFRRGETDYRISALPVGGYVKMAGENPGDPTGDPRDLVAKPRWQRIIIAVMGPAFNILLALALPIGLFMMHHERLAVDFEPAVVGHIVENSPAAKAGVEVGDRIVAVDGEETPTWETVHLAELHATNKTVPVALVRNGERIELAVTLTADERGVGVAGWAEQAKVRLGPINSGSPAERAGIKADDLLVSVNGVEIRSPARVPELIQQNAGKQARVVVRRGAGEIAVDVTPEAKTNEKGESVWMIGVQLNPEYERIATQLGFADACRESLEWNRRNATLIFSFIGGMIEQRMSPKSLEGPIGIARLSGQAARSGAPTLIQLMAMISLNLGIFNLLPIPILDGGVITLLLLESVMRRDLSMAVKERIVQVGLVFILLLFVFVMYNDILKSIAQS